MTLKSEYADDVNRACDDGHGLTQRVYEYASALEHTSLHGYVHDAHHREHVNVRGQSFREYDDVRVAHLLKIAFQSS